MTSIFENIERQSLRRRVSPKPREAILSDERGDGERLVELKLTSQFATSLTTAREALIELEENGFVTEWPNSSSYVTRPAPESAGKIFAVWRAPASFAVLAGARLAIHEQDRDFQTLSGGTFGCPRIQQRSPHVEEIAREPEDSGEYRRNACLHAAWLRVVV